LNPGLQQPWAEISERFQRFHRYTPGLALNSIVQSSTRRRLTILPATFSNKSDPLGSFYYLLIALPERAD
jgi:hypothetical protein